MKRQIVVLATAISSLLLASSSLAHEAGQLIYRVGVGGVVPDDKNLVLDESTYIDVDVGRGVTLNLTYFFTPNVAFDILAAFPFKHDIHLVVDGANPRVGETKHLPPTLSFQYHFLPESEFQPYVGIGANWTTFFSTETVGALEGATLKLDDSFGVAGQIGADILVGEDWVLNLDVRYIDIETDAELLGSDLGAVAIDPMVYSVSLGYLF